MKNIHVSVLNEQGVDGANADAAVGPSVILLIGWRARLTGVLLAIAVSSGLVFAWLGWREAVANREQLRTIDALLRSK